MYAIIAVLLILVYPSVFALGVISCHLYYVRKYGNIKSTKSDRKNDKEDDEQKMKEKKISEYFDTIIDFTGGEE